MNMALLRPRMWQRFLGILSLERNEVGRRWFCHKTKEDWAKLRPMIKKRIENRAKLYPIKTLIPVAQHVLNARSLLINGVSTLLKAFPAVTCKFCPEVYVGETGHLIQTCHGFKNRHKNKVHTWIPAGLNDIIVPVETFHLNNMFRDVIKHHQRFDFDRVPAVIELCCQAGAHVQDLDLQPPDSLSHSIVDAASLNKPASSLNDELKAVANNTIRAWETLRGGVEKLLLVYPTKVCKHCNEVHVGASGHSARYCGLFKYQSWRGAHYWEKATVDDLVPPKIVWRRRPQDPPILLDEGRNYYGHAPAVVDLCTKAGVSPPSKYLCMMKVQGLTVPSSGNIRC